MADPQRAIDLAGWKAEHDLAALVEDLTGQQIIRHKIRCPFHADSTPSLHVFDDGRWKCFGCGKHGDHYDFLGLAWFGEGYSLKAVLDRLADAAPPLRAIAPPNPDAAPLRPALDPGLPDKLTAKMGDTERALWRRVSLSADVLYQHHVGWTGERWAFPWYYRSVFTALKLRRCDVRSPHLEPKYISARGSRYAAPYNVDAVLQQDAPDLVLICEDEKSVLAASSYGYTAISVPANGWRAEWDHLLWCTERVVIVADNDDNGAGLESAARLQAHLRRADVLTVPMGKDLFDYHVWLRETLQDKQAARQNIACWLNEL